MLWLCKTKLWLRKSCVIWIQCKIKSKYGENTKFRYIDINSFSVYIKTDCIYKDIAEDVETWFDNSNYESDRPLPKGKHEKVIG